MDFKEIIQKRRSYRMEFLDKTIPKEDIKFILEACYNAPSGCNLQTSRIIAVLNPIINKKLSDIFGVNYAKTSKASIVILGKALTKKGKGKTRYIEDFAACAMSLILAATDRNLSTCWIQGQIEGEKAELMKKVLKVDDDYELLGYFPLGYAAKEAKRVEKIPFEEICFLDEFNNKFE